MRFKQWYFGRPWLGGGSKAWLCWQVGCWAGWLSPRAGDELADKFLLLAGPGCRAGLVRLYVARVCPVAGPGRVACRESLRALGQGTGSKGLVRAHPHELLVLQWKVKQPELNHGAVSLSYCSLAGASVAETTNRQEKLDYRVRGAVLAWSLCNE
ncbi:hypothetical protein B0T25DRAFT_6248 [Lasiosphaeria hispida]|uniref:Uncharacterized protein n=1 Tax=Lasiosphaeria hispida TaxID=260671 RepID=A0AAJ0HT60_9PEZI|nr:hypothetical protein B0T25DRAFT_6248 [Lasiosphaeria hispida]